MAKRLTRWTNICLKNIFEHRRTLQQVVFILIPLGCLSHFGSDGGVCGHIKNVKVVVFAPIMIFRSLPEDALSKNDRARVGKSVLHLPRH